MTTSSNHTISPLPATSIAMAEQQSLLTFCKASADQLRLDILRVLSHDSYSVLELCSIFDTKQSGMSHHLKILAKAALVKTRREGNTIFYRRANLDNHHQLNELQHALYCSIDQQPISSVLQNGVDAVQQERTASSQLFFTENADLFSQQQEQIAAYELYGHNTIDLINRSINNNGIVLEVGPGEGAFLAELSPRFQQVYALDNSQKMLDKAARFVAQSAFDNITFIYGDTKHSQIQQLNADCVVINMVLHHTPSPAEIFYDIAAALKTDGQLFVTDLCSHDQSWARESCGDLWLGFEPEDLSQWAADAGFTPGEDIYLAQRNGFRVQIRQFIKQ